MTYRVLLVGLGQIGMGYDLGDSNRDHVFTHARAFTVHPAFELVGAVDPNDGARSRFEQHYQLPVYADLGEALSACAPEIVVVAVPTPMHAAAVNRILAAGGVRAILCEKPLSYDLAEARELVASCARKGTSLYVNYMRRSEPAAIEIARRIKAGAIATPVKGVAWYSKGFLHNASHLFNLLELWLGPVQSSKLLEPGRAIGSNDAEPDVSVSFSAGTVVFLAAREEDYSHYTIELVTPSGRLRYDRAGESVRWENVVRDPDFDGYNILASKPESLASDMQRYQWHVADQLAAAMEGKPAHLCSGEQALATLESMQTIMGQR